jgi:hypothetical protein
MKSGNPKQKGKEELRKAQKHTQNEQEKLKYKKLTKLKNST